MNGRSHCVASVPRALIISIIHRFRCAADVYCVRGNFNTTDVRDFIFITHQLFYPVWHPVNKEYIAIDQYELWLIEQYQQQQQYSMKWLRGRTA